MPVTDINPNNSGSIMLGLADPPTDEFSCQVINFAVEPVPNATTSAGTFCRAPVNGNGASSWQVSFEYLQDWGATPSISEFLFDNDGTPVKFKFAPSNAGVPAVSGEFIAIAGPFGGAAGESWTGTGTCGMTGAPTFTPPVAALAATGDDTETE